MIAEDAAPRVTLVVVPRERFSHARASLQSLLDHTNVPFELVYVDVGSPRPLRALIEARAAETGFAGASRARCFWPVDGAPLFGRQRRVAESVERGHVPVQRQAVVDPVRRLERREAR